MVRPFDIPRPVTRIVLGRKVEEEVRCHWRVREICLVVEWNGEKKVLMRQTKVRKGVKTAVIAMRDRFWRIWRTVGEEALSTIV
jgi:hypothetical protein